MSITLGNMSPVARSCPVIFRHCRPGRAKTFTALMNSMLIFRNFNVIKEQRNNVLITRSSRPVMQSPLAQLMSGKPSARGFQLIQFLRPACG
jgi:hypothetical protein